MKDVLKYKDYIGKVHFSAEDEVFFGKLEGIDDLITFEGDNVEQLKSSFQEAVEDYLELCESLGKTPHKSYKGSFNVRINPKLHKQAAYKSVELGLSLNQFVEEAINDKLLIKSTP
ncbi:Predicted nuclease of the RNAse H fold, HicB family [Aquiflexum balticum DSM 16537]|jgi:predicted HicB family RNase H-like nuclease|uniref:Predicted nuclease of the RNAse H fold, HicB family n=1 Tax=Aquiflexum balticum DSM 16537 TaxID=758820 RepID=A0A1W2H741_9BACT|nr:type II toxin-antitoxin system HicB family antitoxin [Aquiflexum balticum]SMD44462.1 Predicted nuclease of the RNAse H fold, HicB family [Aquiflexum balticum DSM 16537]